MMHFAISTKKPEAPSTAYGHGTLPSSAAAAATELMLLRRSWCCAQLASLFEVPPRPSARCCKQHLEKGRDDETTSQVLGCSAAATELQPSRCCNGAAQTSSVALILCVASLGRDARNIQKLE